MRLATGLLAALFLATSFAQAMISSFSAPTATLTPNQTFAVTFFTSNYIQNNAQYYAIFGLKPTSLGLPPSDGLGPGPTLGNGFDFVQNNVSVTGTGSFNVTLQIPADWDSEVTAWTLTSAVMNTVSEALFLQSPSFPVHLLTR